MKIYQRPIATKTPLNSENIMLELSPRQGEGEGDAGSRRFYDLYEEEGDKQDFFGDSWN